MRRPLSTHSSSGSSFRRWFARLYRVDLRGAEQIPATGPVILVANHESMIDPWLLGLTTPRPIRYMAKAELWRNPLLGRVMSWFGTFPVDRGSGDRSPSAAARSSYGRAKCSGSSRREPASPIASGPGIAAPPSSLSRQAPRSCPCASSAARRRSVPGSRSSACPGSRYSWASRSRSQPGRPRSPRPAS